MNARCLLATLVVMALGGPALAAPSLTVGAVSGSPGGVANVPVTLANDAQISAVQFDVLFSAAQVSAVGPPSEGAALASTNHDIESNLVAPGRFRVFILSNTLATIPSGQVAVIPFTIAGGVAPGATVALTLSEVEMVTASAVVIGGSLNAGSIGVVEGCPSPGDIFPDGVGNGATTLADFVHARRKSLGSVAENARDALCGNLHPGAEVCVPASGAKSWCPAPNATAPLIRLGDVLVIRRLVTLAYTVSCAACAPQLAETVARPAGDVAPRGTGDGRVDVADAVLALRASVGLEAPAPDDVFADVAPAERSSAVTFGEGDGRVNIADAVLILRAAVGLETLAWPERTLDLSLPAPIPTIAFSATLAGWPAHARVQHVASAACASEAAGFDLAGERLGIACVSDPVVETGPAVMASIVFVGPRVDAADLALSSTLLGPAMDETADALVMGSR